MREYLATSLDGWLVIKYNEMIDKECSPNLDSKGNKNDLEHRNYNCGLEIKTPSSKKIIHETVRRCVDAHGMFSQCEFGSPAFKQLVYKPEYRTQVLHHTMVANLQYVLFIMLPFQISRK